MAISRNNRGNWIVHPSLLPSAQAEFHEDQGSIPSADQIIAMAEWLYRPRESASAEAASHPAPGLLTVSHCGSAIAALVDRARQSDAYPLEVRDLLHGWRAAALADLIYVYETEHFLIRYTRVGMDAVDLADIGGAITDPGTQNVIGMILPNTGVPDYVERAAFWLELSYESFSSFPLSLQPANGTPPINVVINSVWPPAFGHEINLTRGMVDDQLAEVCIHETFHVFQQRYATFTTQFPEQDLEPAITEGGADMAIDLVADWSNRYIKTEAALREPKWSAAVKRIWTGVGTNGYPYPFSLFLKYYSEQQSYLVGPYNEPRIGADAIRILYQSCHANGYSRAGMEAACAGSSVHGRTFCKISKIGADTSCTEVLLGNFWLALYLKDLPAGTLDRRFTLMENAAGMPGLRILTHQTVDAISTGFVSDSMLGYAAHTCKFDIDAGVDAFEVRLSRANVPTTVLLQVVLVDAFGFVIDIYRTDSNPLQHTFAAVHNGRRVDHLYVVGCSTSDIVGINFTVTAVQPKPDVTVTSWNRAEGTHYEVDPFGWQWAWLSPDIWIQGWNSAGGVKSGVVNKLVVRVRNQGFADATSVTLTCDCQSAANLPLDPSAWAPITDGAGAAVAIPSFALSAGAIQSVSIDWTPPASWSNQPIAIRVRIADPNDANTLNKVAFTILAPAKARFIEIERRFPRPADPLWDPIRYRPSIVSRSGTRTVMPDDSVQLMGSHDDGEDVVQRYRIHSHRGLRNGDWKIAPAAPISRSSKYADKTPSPRGGGVPTTSIPPAAVDQNLLTILFPGISGQGAGLSIPFPTSYELESEERTKDDSEIR